MNTIHRTYSGLQVALMALLPKDSTPVTACQLARATAVSQYQVTTALLAPCLAHEVDYDIEADAYSAPRKKNDLPSGRSIESSTEPETTEGN